MADNSYLKSMYYHYNANIKFNDVKNKIYNLNKYEQTLK